MYRYDEFDAAFVKERTAQFTDQVMRRVRGEINEDQFRPLRLMNGLYLQLHAYMLRIAVPYGTMNSKQLRMLARPQELRGLVAELREHNVALILADVSDDVKARLSRYGFVELVGEDASYEGLGDVLRGAPEAGG